MSKVIIGVHGIGNKPPKEILGQWWRRSLREGLRRIDRPLVFFNFELVYWADIAYKRPLDVNIADPRDPLYLSEIYNPGRNVLRNQQGLIRKRVGNYLKKQVNRLLLNGDMTPNFTSITDRFMLHYFRDMEVYYSLSDPQKDSEVRYRRDEIRGRLAETLERHRGKDILLLSHSMGSIIAYDVLFHTAPDVPVDTLITAGSPLGLPMIVGRIFAEQRQGSAIDRLRTPENVKRNWFNFTDPGDRIAFDTALKDDYAGNSAGVMVNDVEVHNDYENRGELNPHKSYGYLRTPELAQVIYDFLRLGQPAFIRKWSDRANRLFSDFIERYR